VSNLGEALAGLSGTPTPKVGSLEDLADGSLLLAVMHNVCPDLFPQQDAEPFRCLLEGLMLHFQDRQGEKVAANLLDQAAVQGSAFQLLEIARLVVVGTMIGQGEESAKYIKACQNSSDATQQAILNMFNDLEPAQEEAESPVASIDSPLREFQPLARRSSPAKDYADLDVFTDAGIDLETRFRKLKELYVTLMEEKERWDDERFGITAQLESEREKRRAAEQAEKVARQELRLADEARERLKEEHRSMFDTRVELEVSRQAEQFRVLEEEFQQMQDDLDIAKSQVAQAERLDTQLRDCKKMLEAKTEELARQRESNSDLQAQNDNLLSSSQTGAVEHLHRRIEQLRSENLAVVRERDVAQEDCRVLQLNIEKCQHTHRELSDELTRVKRESQRKEASPHRAFSPSGRSPSGSIANLSEEARLSLFRLDGQATTPARARKDSRPHTPSRRDSKPKPPPLPLDSQASDPAVSESPSGKSGGHTELLERLLVANERATRAETTLQMQKAQADNLTEQVKSDAARIKSLEDELQRGKEALKDMQERQQSSNETTVVDAARVESARVQMLEGQILQKERELQVYRWRGQTDSNSLAQQESFMGACFHEIGVRYHKLRTQHELLKRKALLAERQRAGAAPSSVAVAAAKKSGGSEETSTSHKK